MIVFANVNLCLLLAFSSKRLLGTRDVALPSNRSFGQRYAPPLGDLGCLPIGLSLSKLATSKFLLVTPRMLKYHRRWKGQLLVLQI